MFFDNIIGVYMKVRDTQRSKLYKSERAALQSFSLPLPAVADVAQYLEKQSKRQPLQNRYGAAVDVTNWKLRVADGRGCRRALAYGTYQIAIPLWARQDWVVLHEWAHIIHNRLSARGTLNGSRTSELRGGAAHGWQYAAIYLDLVHFCMGKEAADALKAAFKDHKVRFRPKRTRTVTPEQIARLAAMRVAARPK